MRGNAPFGWLEIDGPQLTVGILFFRVRVQPIDLELVFPVQTRTRLSPFGRYRGVCMRRLDGREYKFWTGTTAVVEILQILRRSGFPVIGGV